MNTYTPLTPQQYQSARSAGFSPDQIIQNEQQRKASMTAGSGTNFGTQDKSWTTGDAHVVPQLGDALLGKPDSPTPNAFAGAVRPLLNLPSSLLQGVEDTAKVIPATIATARAPGGATNLGRAALDLGETLSGYKLAKGLGDTVLGGIQAGVSKLTGKPVENNDQAAAFNTAKNAITHPLDTATSVAQGIYNTSQENPMTIPLALDAAGQALNKAGVKNVGPIETKDVISSVAEPVKQAASAIAEPLTTALKDPAMQARADQFSKILNQSKGTTATELKYEKNSPQFAAQLEQEGVKFPFSKDGRGRLDTTEAQSNLDTVAARDNASMDKLLETSGTYINLDDMADAAKAEARQTYKGTAQQTALQHIDEEFNAYKQQYANRGFDGENGFTVPSKVANEIKQDLWSKSKFPPLGSPTDQTKAGTSFLMGQSIKTGIEDQIGQDNLVSRLNQRLGDIQSLKTSLQKAQGGAVHGGFVGRMTARILGGVAGSAGGPAGSVLGAITADTISQALTDPNMPLSWSQAVLGRAETEMPDILKEVEARIGKNSQDIINRKLLPEPTTIIPPNTKGTPGPNYNLPTEPMKPSGDTIFEKSVPNGAKGATTPSGAPSEKLQSKASSNGTQEASVAQADSPKTVFGKRVYDNVKNPKLGLSTGDVTKNIHPADLKVMKDFISYARNPRLAEFNLSDTQYADAERLAAKFGISMDKGLSKVATNFENIVSGATKAPRTNFGTNK